MFDLGELTENLAKSVPPVPYLSFNFFEIEELMNALNYLIDSQAVFDDCDQYYSIPHLKAIKEKIESYQWH